MREREIKRGRKRGREKRATKSVLCNQAHEKKAAKYMYLYF